MIHILKWIKKEILHVLPAVIYFFVVFNLFNLTFGRMLAGAGAQGFSFMGIVMTSLVVGKVILVLDELPFIDAFPHKPLVYNTLWKTFVYSFVAFLIRIAGNLIPRIAKYKDLDVAWQHLLKEISWSQFWTIHVWFVVLFLIFVVSRQLIRAVGGDRLRQVFFGK